MPGLTITIHGIPALDGRLNRLGRAAMDLSEPMREIGQYLTRFFSGQVFASRGRVIGEPWAPLNPQYAAAKAREYPGRPPLVRTGELIQSYKFEANRTSSRIWNESDHFNVHQEGTRFMPARVLMKVDAARGQQIGQIVARHLERAGL